MNTFTFGERCLESRCIPDKKMSDFIFCVWICAIAIFDGLLSQNCGENQKVHLKFNFELFYLAVAYLYPKLLKSQRFDSQ